MLKRLFIIITLLVLAACEQQQTAVVQQPAAGADTVQVRMQTSEGDIVMLLDRAKAPGTVDNFVSYIKSGFYDGTVFHRVIDNFMIQGGGYTLQLQKKRTRLAIQNEANNGLKNKRGTIAMARTSDPHSATAQFFINVKDNDFLDHRDPTPRGWGYCVFGKVIEGMNVVDKIKVMPTGPAGPFRSDVPITPVVIQKMTIESISAKTGPNS